MRMYVQMNFHKVSKNFLNYRFPTGLRDFF